MTSKSILPFQPAPRPQPRMSPEDTKRLQEATQDLGFGRPTSTPTPPAPAADPQIVAPLGAPSLPTKTKLSIPPKKAAKPSVAKEAVSTFKDAALKITVPDDLWNSLRMEALKRRVTVKFLVLEALAAKGYEVDLDAIPEDGRRLR